MSIRGEGYNNNHEDPCFSLKRRGRTDVCLGAELWLRSKVVSRGWSCLKLLGQLLTVARSKDIQGFPRESESFDLNMFGAAESVWNKPKLAMAFQAPGTGGKEAT